MWFGEYHFPNFLFSVCQVIEMYFKCAFSPHKHFLVIFCLRVDLTERQYLMRETRFVLDT